MAIDGTPRPRVLLVATNDPTAASGLGIRLRTTIDGLSRVGEVDVVAFGGSDLSAAPDHVRELFSACVGSYRTAPRQPTSPTLGGYVRWLTSLRVPRQIYFSDRAAERADLPDVASYDVVWCASTRAFTIVEPTHPRILLTDLSQYEADRDLDLVSAGREGGSRDTLIASGRSLVARLDHDAWQRLYRRAVAASTTTTICSDHDRDLLGARSVVVIPNSYPDPGEPPRRQSTDAPVILFVGHFPYRPNEDAARSLAHEILPEVRARVPGARLRLVGNPTPAVEALATLPGVSVTGFSRSLDSELRTASLVAAPLGVVAGTSVKIIEAFAYGVPVVASPAATTGLLVESGREVEVGETPREFALACVLVLSNEATRRARIRSARACYEAHYRSATVAERVATVARAALTMPS